MKRLRYIDAAKSLAIIATLVGHTAGIPKLLLNFVFTFHMPLFFFCSGYLMKDEGKLSALVKKDAKNLLLPYAVTGLLLIVSDSIRALIFHEDALAAMKTWFFATLYGSGTVISPYAGDTHIIGAIWFLPALFFAKLIVYLTRDTGKSRFVLLLGLFFFGYVSSSRIWLPLSIQAGICAAPFLYFGMELKKYDFFNRSYSAKRIPALFLCVGIWAFCTRYYGRMYMVGNNYADGVVDVVGAVCAFFAIVWVCMFIDNHIQKLSVVLSVIGKSTLAILAMHNIEIYVFPWSLFFERTHIQQTWVTMLIFRFILVGLMCLVIRFIPFINRLYYPHLRASAEKKA